MTHRSKLALKVLMPLVVFIAAELILRDVFQYRARLVNIERKSLAAYQGTPGVDQYLADLLDCASQSLRKHQLRYARYVLQTVNEDCTTQTVNYANRIRRTWNPQPREMPPGAVLEEVGVFGGSTVEGLGAIDVETIPSQLSRIANAATTGVAYHVTNYGVSGYTFTQSVFKLITLLREGRHLDEVIFYNGANDVEYAYGRGEAGGLEGEDVLEAKLEGGTWDKLRQFGKEQMNACVLCLTGLIVARHAPLLQDYLTPHLVKLDDAISFKQGQAADLSVEPFAQRIADYYAQSHALFVTIADAYHIRHLEFWQPTLLDADRYAPGEASLANLDPRLTDVKLRQLYKRSHDAVVAKNLSDFYDLSRVIDGRPKAYYVDAVHLSGDGNRIVANRIHEAWKPSREKATSVTELSTPRSDRPVRRVAQVGTKSGG